MAAETAVVTASGAVRKTAEAEAAGKTAGGRNDQPGHQG